MSLQTDLQAAVDSAEANAAKLDAYVHGPAAGGDSLVTVDSGPLKTLARQQAEHDAAVLAGVIGPAPWATPVPFANGIVCTPATATDPATAFVYDGATYVCVIGHATSGGAPDLAKVIMVAAKGDDAALTLTTKGDLLGRDGTEPVRVPVGADGSIVVARAAAAAGVEYISALRSQIWGLTYANNAGDATNDIDVAVGGCMSDDGTEWIAIAATTKQLDVAAAADNGATPSGMLGPAAAIGNNDYALYAIKNPTTGECRVFAEKQDTAPTLPGGFTKKRQFGFIQRVAGAIATFSTYELEGGGLHLLWKALTVDFNHTNVLTNARRTDPIRAPRTFSVLAQIAIITYDSVTSSSARIVCPDEADAAVVSNGSVGTMGIMNWVAGSWVAEREMWVRTSATGTIAARCEAAINVDQYTCSTSGFIWSRR
jgi:hypothetical protein